MKKLGNVEGISGGTDWVCKRCGYISAWWKGGAEFELCTRCEAEMKAGRVRRVASEQVRDRLQERSEKRISERMVVREGKVVWERY